MHYDEISEFERQYRSIKEAYREHPVVLGHLQPGIGHYSTSPDLPPRENRGLGQAGSSTGVDERGHVAQLSAAPSCVVLPRRLHSEDLSLDFWGEEDQIDRITSVSEVRRSKQL